MRTRIRTLGLICLLMMGCTLSMGKKEVKSWQELFTEPFERVLIILKDKDNPDDGIILRFTDHLTDKVFLNVENVEEELNKHGYKIENIEVVIHNHFIRCRFSLKDESLYRRLKSSGFNGRFLLYCHRTGEVYNIEKEKGYNRPDA